MSPILAQNIGFSGLSNGRPHIGANGVSWRPEKMDDKLESENMQKIAVFWISELIIMFMLYFESNQGRQESGAMLTTYKFRYTSECTIS